MSNNQQSSIEIVDKLEAEKNPIWFNEFVNIDKLLKRGTKWPLIVEALNKKYNLTLTKQQVMQNFRHSFINRASSKKDTSKK